MILACSSRTAGFSRIVASSCGGIAVTDKNASARHILWVGESWPSTSLFLSYVSLPLAACLAVPLASHSQHPPCLPSGCFALQSEPFFSFTSQLLAWYFRLPCGRQSCLQISELEMKLDRREQEEGRESGKLNKTTQSSLSPY